MLDLDWMEVFAQQINRWNWLIKFNFFSRAAIFLWEPYFS